jgi:hypothetical protein
MSEVQLIVGAGQLDRLIENANDLLQKYRQDTGCYYLDHQPITPADAVVPEDLAVTLLVNSQVSWRAFRSLQLYGGSIDLKSLPLKPLEGTTLEERYIVGDIIAKMAGLPGFAASVATKVLHKKRPDLIPILDNQAIFGAYMNKNWPIQLGRSESVKNQEKILLALNYIAFDLNREENSLAWRRLQAMEPTRTRIQLFDGVWWMYFRLKQPVKRASAKAG